LVHVETSQKDAPGMKNMQISRIDTFFCFTLHYIAMENKQTTKRNVPKSVWWSIIPSCFVALVWGADFVFNKLSHDGPQALTAILTILSLPIAFAMFLVLVWTPLLGITLTACTLCRLAKPYYVWKEWILFAVLLPPFCCCFQILLTLPTMAAYRQLLHL
jgi:hypothetical protein